MDGNIRFPQKHKIDLQSTEFVSQEVLQILSRLKKKSKIITEVFRKTFET